jgi:hypothetical protein
LKTSAWADQVGADQEVVELAALVVEHVPVGGRDGLAVEEHAVQVRIRALDADALALAEEVVDRHTGEVGERLREVEVGELAHVLGRDHLDVVLGGPLGLRREDSRLLA